MRTAVIAALSFFLLAATQQQGRRPKQGKGIAEGKDAKDLKLLVLPKTQKEAKKKQYVTLSSQKGKKPLFLIFGSYT